MTAHGNRYFLGALAFATIVTWATVGLLVAFLAAAACGAVVYAPRLGRPVASRKPRPARRRLTAYELVPDEPSLVLSISE